MTLQRCIVLGTLLLKLAVVVGLPNSCVGAALYSTVRTTQFYSYENHALHVLETMPEETLVVGTRMSTIQGTSYVLVRFAAFNLPPMWCMESDLKEMKDVVAEEIAHSDVLPGNEKDSLIPLAIRQQRSAKLKNAWLSIDRVINDNEALPETKRIPEPYFARAELWMAVHNYPDAMSDFLKALHYASSSGREMHLYARYHPKIQSTIENFKSVPAAPAGAFANTEFSAFSHYSQGVSAFRVRRFEDAKFHFVNASSIKPATPLFWYYRSITAKKTGDLNQAIYDALYGAFIESQLEFSYDSYNHRRVTYGLQHIQGADRIWLERFRLGDPSRRILDGVIK